MSLGSRNGSPSFPAREGSLGPMPVAAVAPFSKVPKTRSQKQLEQCERKDAHRQLEGMIGEKVQAPR